MTPKLKNLFSFELKAPIWKMELDAGEKLLAIEAREGETLEVSYALLDLGANRLLLQDLAFEAGWLSGLSGMSGGILLFYTYEDPQNPAHKDAFAFKVATGEVSWAYSGYSHLAFYNGASIGMSQQGEERSFSRIALSTGALTALSEAEGLALLGKGKQEQERKEKKYAYPLQYVSDSPNFATVQAFLKSGYKRELVQGCEYLEIFDKIIISYYTANGEKLSNYLLVCNAEGEALLHVCINKAGGGAGLDTFFVADRKLIFTREKRIIESYEI